MTHQILAIVSDFSRVVLFPVDKGYTGSLNVLNHELLKQNFSYDFESYFSLNKEILTFYSGISVRLPVYIFTSDSVQDHPAIKDKVHEAVRAVYSAKQLQVSKSEPDSYKRIANMLHINPENILYVDDQQSNVEAAHMAGCKTILFTDNISLISEVLKYLKQS